MNLAQQVRELFDALWGERMFRAVVTGTSGNLVTVKRTGQGSADPQSYAKLASYSAPAVNDEVLVVKVGGGWLVCGKVTR